MKKISIVIAGIIVLGFAIGKILPERNLCTQMLITCSADYTGETKGNGCVSRKPIFVAGVVDVIRSRPVQEIIKCTNGLTSTEYQQTGEYQYEIIPFFILKNYLY